MQQERRIEANNNRNTLPGTNNLNEAYNLNANYSSSNTNNSAYYCIVDRNRLIKYSSTSSSGLSKLKSASSNVLPQSSSIISNINLFYDLLQSMPELSKVEIK